MLQVKIFRAPERVGLIRARLLGAAKATAPVLTFLDSHIECTPGWLEPLVDRIARNATNVVCPVIDVIDTETLEYQGNGYFAVGGFDWNLQWCTWDSHTGLLKHAVSRKCLTVAEDHKKLNMAECEAGEDKLRWDVQNFNSTLLAAE